MLKLSAVSLAFLAIGASGASACITVDKDTDIFTNSCDTPLYIEYRTVGGGCYTVKHGAASIKAQGEWHDPKLSEACGAVGKFHVNYAWCDQTERDDGTCKLNY
ncbi:hypothetical protein JI58_04155 [Marinosulfonomonas sp. PRT-SC04]|nr:hypothetical protein JI58_04155 [Marinosulfonomonas sp. PRT-SC04]